MPEIARDTLLEENFVFIVFGVVGGAQSMAATKRLVLAANDALPGIVVVLVCWLVMIACVALSLITIELVEKLAAAWVAACAEI